MYSYMYVVEPEDVVKGELIKNNNVQYIIPGTYIHSSKAKTVHNSVSLCKFCQCILYCCMLKKSYLCLTVIGYTQIISFLYQINLVKYVVLVIINYYQSILPGFKLAILQLSESYSLLHCSVPIKLVF